MDWVLAHLREAGLTHVAIATAHLGHLIEAHYGNGAAFGMQISYVREGTPMGTGGWSQLVDWDQLADPFLVINADNVFWVDLPALRARHQQEAALATIAAIPLPSQEVHNYELILPSADGRRVVDYVDRSASAALIAAQDEVLINAGWYLFSPRSRSLLPSGAPLSNEKDILPALVRAGATLGCYLAREPWFDTGTPERLARVDAFIKQQGYVVESFTRAA